MNPQNRVSRCGYLMSTFGTTFFGSQDEANYRSNGKSKLDFVTSCPSVTRD